MRLYVAAALVAGSALVLLALAATPDARGLVARLEAESAAERDRAATELLALGDAAEPALIEATRGGPVAVRRRARALLATLRDTGGREARLTEARALWRVSAGSADGAAARDALASLGDDAARALATEAHRQAVVGLVDADLTEALGRQVSAATVSALAGLLVEDRLRASDTLRAARHLAAHPDAALAFLPTARRDLERVLRGARGPRRRAAAALLAACCDLDSALPRARELASDDEPGVRIEAARWLSRLGIGAGATLDLLADDPETSVRVAALEALVEIPGSPRPGPAVRNAEHADPAVRAAAAALLARDAVPDTESVLHRLLADESPRVRAAAERSATALARR